jgi:hypothetical protein
MVSVAQTRPVWSRAPPAPRTWWSRMTSATSAGSFHFSAMTMPSSTW